MELVVAVLAVIIVLGVILWFDHREIEQHNAMVRDWQQATGDLAKAMKRTEGAIHELGERPAALTAKDDM